MDRILRMQLPAAGEARSAQACRESARRKPRMIMGAEVAAHSLPDTYFDLVRTFPRVHLRDLCAPAGRSAVIDDLLRRDLDEGGRAYRAP